MGKAFVGGKQTCAGKVAGCNVGGGNGDTLFYAFIAKSFGDDVVGEAHEVDDYAARIDGGE